MLLGEVCAEFAGCVDDSDTDTGVVDVLFQQADRGDQRDGGGREDVGLDGVHQPQFEIVGSPDCTFEC
ncbi:hypothetical protein BJF84_21225 [Rhodococcus sp. CUA-806]|nr:hypothetical protein BJF84_21225 [Rhodococcus sp. CUA-806]